MTEKKRPFCSSVKCQCFMFFLTAACVAVVVCVALLVKSIRFRRPPDQTWWQTSIVYQIYPRSFMDSDSSGTGDLRGIINKMDHFPYLNVKAIWISPVFESPMKDFGYDISNFTNIDPIFGNLTDMTELIKEAHDRDVNVILDFVPNHSSDKHKWFNMSENGVEKYKDYYIWADGKNSSNGTMLPPNNWLSVFRYSAWQWSEKRKQFYYHAFLKEQPDLNYRNPDVVEEMKDALRFWLERGVDGFRIDALANLFEVENLTKNEPRINNSGYDKTQWESLDHIYTQNQVDDLHRILDGWRGVLDEFENKDKKTRYMVVEAYTRSKEERNAWYATGADMPFNFALVSDMRPDCNGTCIADIVHGSYEDLPDGAWPNFVTGNHDNRRISTRRGKEYIDVMNMLLLTLRGTPTTYYGEEIGMLDVEPSFNDSVDPAGLAFGKDFLEHSRDPERSPMQWCDCPMAGFTNNSHPWLPVGDNYHTINVETEKNATGFSTLKLYRKLAILREEPAFKYGKLDDVVVNDNIYSYLRYAVDFPSYLVTMNFGNMTSSDNYSKIPVNATKGAVIATTRNNGYKVDEEINLRNVTLSPAQGLVIKV